MIVRHREHPVAHAERRFAPRLLLGRLRQRETDAAHAIDRSVLRHHVSFGLPTSVSTSRLWLPRRRVLPAVRRRWLSLRRRRLGATASRRAAMTALTA